MPFTKVSIDESLSLLERWITLSLGVVDLEVGSKVDCLMGSFSVSESDSFMGSFEFDPLSEKLSLSFLEDFEGFLGCGFCCFFNVGVGVSLYLLGVTTGLPRRVVLLGF